MDEEESFIYENCHSVILSEKFAVNVAQYLWRNLSWSGFPISIFESAAFGAKLYSCHTQPVSVSMFQSKEHNNKEIQNITC